MTLPELSSYTPPLASKPQIPQMVMPTLSQIGPRMKVDRVKGFEGAKAYNIGPDSSVLLLDADLDVLWIVMTDQNGEKALIEGRHIGGKYDPPKPVTMEDLMTEMREMRGKIERLEGGEKRELPAQSDGQIQPDGKCNQPG